MVSASAKEEALARPRASRSLPAPALLPPPSVEIDGAAVMDVPETTAVPVAEEIVTAPPLSNADVKNLQRLLQGKHQATDIGCVIHNLSRVDEHSGTFDADFTLYQRWRANLPAVSSDPDMRALRSTSRPTFANGLTVPKVAESGAWPEEVVKDVEPNLIVSSRPCLAFPNAASVQPIAGSLQCFLSPNDAPGLVRAEERFQGTFRCKMPITDFPFDCHTLTISVMLDKQRDAHRTFRQIEGPDGDSLLELQHGALPNGWMAPLAPDAAIDRDASGANGRALYTLSLGIVRADSTSYVWSCVVPAGLASVLCLPAFALPASMLVGRMSLVLILLLAAACSRLLLGGPLASSRANGSGTHSAAAAYRTHIPPTRRLAHQAPCSEYALTSVRSPM